MHEYICIYMYVCIYMYILYICVYICIYICMHVYLETRTLDPWSTNEMHMQNPCCIHMNVNNTYKQHLSYDLLNRTAPLQKGCAVPCMSTLVIACHTCCLHLYTYTYISVYMDIALFRLWLKA